MNIENIFEGLHGPGSFRFFIQPMIAIFLGVRDGKKDAKAFRQPYFISLFTSDDHRGVLKDGFMSIMKPFILAWVMDTAFQIFVLDRWSHFQATVAALMLVALPYILVRGLTNRAMTGIGRHGT